MAGELEDAFHTALIGTEQTVLFEQPEAGFFTGHAPNYVKVYAEAGDLHNQLRRVRVAGLCRDGVLGELVDEAEKNFLKPRKNRTKVVDKSHLCRYNISCCETQQYMAA
ncbi:MAG: hypothetical protein V8T01_08925 [Oscillospiraceae bacterium]